MPNASAEEREQALDSLTRLAPILMRIEDRLARQWHEQQIRDSGAPVVESELQTPPSS
jgi:cbb3-type cytochrome oxidase cytochrome c subunit